MDLSAVFDLERLGIVPRPMTGRARCIDARQEQQLDHHEAFALAMGTTALGDVEGKASRIVATGARLLGCGEKLADVIEKAGIGGEIRARRAPDRLLVDPHQALDPFHAADDPASLAWNDRPLELLALFLLRRNIMAQMLRDQFDQGLADQARLAGAGYSRDTS